MSASDRLDVAWLGHATARIDIGDVHVLTDPALTPRLAHLRRHHTVDRRALDDVDVVLISHVHMDHLHLPSLRLLGDVRVVVPAGAGQWMRRHGFSDVVETQPGERVRFGELEIEAVPAVHPPGRGPHSRLQAAAVGYVLRSPHAAVYFAGDTDLFEGMADLGAIDVALLPVGGWGESLGSGHLDPLRAARASELIQPRLVVPVHWGTYSPMLWSRRPSWLRLPADRFATAMTASGQGDRLRLLEPGGRLGQTAGSVPPADGR